MDYKEASEIFLKMGNLITGENKTLEDIKKEFIESGTKDTYLDEALREFEEKLNNK